MEPLIVLCGIYAAIAWVVHTAWRIHSASYEAVSRKDHGGKTGGESDGSGAIKPQSRIMEWLCSTSRLLLLPAVISACAIGMGLASTFLLETSIDRVRHVAEEEMAVARSAIRFTLFVPRYPLNVEHLEELSALNMDHPDESRQSLQIALLRQSLQIALLHEELSALNMDHPDERRRSLRAIEAARSFLDANAGSPTFISFHCARTKFKLAEKVLAKIDAASKADKAVEAKADRPNTAPRDELASATDALEREFSSAWSADLASALERVRDAAWWCGLWSCAIVFATYWCGAACATAAGSSMGPTLRQDLRATEHKG